MQPSTASSVVLVHGQVIDIVSKAYKSTTAKAGDSVEFITRVAGSAVNRVKKAAASVVEAWESAKTSAVAALEVCCRLSYLIVLACEMVERHCTL